MLSWQVYSALVYLGNLINLLIMVRVVLSWIRPNPSNPLVALVYSVTDPIMEPIKNLIFRLGYKGMIDFSPFLAIFLVNFIINLIGQYLV